MLIHFDMSYSACLEIRHAGKYHSLITQLSFIVTQNIFTVDWEEWYHANYRDQLPACRQGQWIIRPTYQILETLSEHNCRATFFIVGELVQKYKTLIREIEANGHEIASHGFRHSLVSSLSVSDFKDDLRKVTDVLGTLTGKAPIGYRAPSWSVSQQSTSWFWSALAEQGYRYSSSRMPFKTFLYGDPLSPQSMHEIDGISEIPMNVFPIPGLGKSLPFSGGFYLRLFPSYWIRHATRRLNKKGQPVIFYLHPREVDPHQPRIPGLTPKERFIHYYGLRRTGCKISHLLEHFPTVSFAQFLGETAAARKI